MHTGGKVPDARPGGFFLADKVGPRVGFRFRFHQPVLRCHEVGGLVRSTEMEPTEAEKLKARRIQRLLYVLVALMIGIPFIIFILQTFR
jgi:uncharacterized membrane protein